MQHCLKIAGLLALAGSLIGCTVAVEPNQGSCSVHDYKGRKWASAGPRACRIALNRCERWHRNHHPNANWKCMHD
jgi:hypothetical protein